MADLIPCIGNHKIEFVPSEEDDETCKTFVLHNEDHTLGNSLRYMLMKNPEVEFCGYSVPHPSENKINLRIQTREKPAVDALKNGLNNLGDVSEHILDIFQKAVSDFKNKQSEDRNEMETED